MDDWKGTLERVVFLFYEKLDFFFFRKMFEFLLSLIK